jgi:hypothetical protein
MESYKGYFIDGMPVSVHPVSPDWYVGGTVLKKGRFTTIVEVTRFQFLEFTVDIKELACWFGLELARMVVEECLGANKIEPSRD